MSANQDSQAAKSGSNDVGGLPTGIGHVAAKGHSIGFKWATDGMDSLCRVWFHFLSKFIAIKADTRCGCGRMGADFHMAGILSLFRSGKGRDHRGADVPAPVCGRANHRIFLLLRDCRSGAAHRRRPLRLQEIPSQLTQNKSQAFEVRQKVDATCDFRPLYSRVTRLPIYPRRFHENGFQLPVIVVLLHGVFERT